ncbi:MAG: hypothetical protein ACI9CO_001511 [Candidatus Azotimanducaceae bacterium]|jgi:hypothetical protein
MKLKLRRRLGRFYGQWRYSPVSFSTTSQIGINLTFDTQYRLYNFGILKVIYDY